MEQHYLSETYTGMDSDHDDFTDSKATLAHQPDLSRVSTNFLLPVPASLPLLTNYGLFISQFHLVLM